MRVIAYLRVSSDGQVEGYGLDAQKQAVERWCRANGHRLVRTVSDAGVSGATDALDRPGFGEVIAALLEGEAEGLALARLDRLARALTVQEASLAIVWRAGGRVFAADSGEILADDPEDPMRTALRQVVGVFAELDRRMVVKRLRDGRSIKSASGRKSVGSYAYGQRAGGRGRTRDAVQHPDEAVTVEEILRLRSSGESFRAIARALNDRGISAKRGGMWHPMSVRSIVIRYTRA